MEKFVTAQFFINPESVEKFKVLTSELIENTRKEQGNVFYQLYQSLENPCDFIFYEIFKDQKSFDFHANTEYFKKFVQAIGDISYKEAEVKVIS